MQYFLKLPLIGLKDKYTVKKIIWTFKPQETEKFVLKNI
jgi:hypothetical protein